MNINKTLKKVMMKVEGKNKKGQNSNLVMDNKTYSYKLPTRPIASKIKVITTEL